MLNLNNRWALVTGSSRGVGRQVAIGLAECGCNLVLHSRSLEHTSELADKLQKEGIRVLCVAADLGNEQDIDRIFHEIEKQGITIDIVYNVAGVNSNVLDFFATPLEYYRTTFAVNVFAAVQICNYFVPKMLQNGFGRIVNVISTIENEPKAMAYAASKAALEKLTKEMGYAVNGTKVTINAADPGWLRTDMGTDNAPNAVEYCKAGMLLPVIMNDNQSGRIFHAEHYYGMSLEDAFAKEQSEHCAQMPEYLAGAQQTIEKVCSLREFELKYAGFINSKKKKVIFGGGNQARFYLDIFRYLNCPIDAIICTNPAGQSHLSGVKLYPADAFLYPGNECVVIIAITEKHMSGVADMLEEQGYNVFPLYSVLYTEDAWKKADGNLVSDIYQYEWDTFSGKRVARYS